MDLKCTFWRCGRCIQCNKESIFWQWTWISFGKDCFLSLRWCLSEYRYEKWFNQLSEKGVSLGRIYLVFCSLPGVSTERCAKGVDGSNNYMSSKSLLPLWKLSKKLRELKKLHELLKEIYEFDDERVKPHRAAGTRWIAHKLEALQNMLDKYGLYMHRNNRIC